MPNALSQLIDAAMQILAPTLLVIGTWLAHRIVSVIEAHAGVKISSAQEDMIDTYVAKGITYAEEKATSALKNATGAITGPQKLELATDFVLDFASKHGWIDVTRDRVKALVESKLNTTRSTVAISGTP